MKLLNLGCGGSRPLDLDWVNIDNLHVIFPNLAAPERRAMDAEPNYLNHDLRNGIPFGDNTIDGVLCSHLLEHLDCQEALKLLKDIYRSLKFGGVLRISVPDPGKFHTMTIEGCKDWGEPNPSSKSFMEYALFFAEHKQLLSIDSLYCLLLTSGFKAYKEVYLNQSSLQKLSDLDNRSKFSIYVEATK